MNLKRIIFLVGSLCVSFFSDAQNLSQHNWYFGSSARAIRFSRTNNQPALVNKVPLGIGGSAVATNASNGNVLFYTDGVNIYDASNVLMTNGGGLSGNTSANQPAVICPVPEDSTKYLVFTNDATYNNLALGTVKVSVVDMTLFSGHEGSPVSPPLGKVISKNMGTGLSVRSEGMIIIPHSNGKDYWLITHLNGSTSFTSSLITKTSFNPAAGGSFAFFSATIFSGLGIPMSVANFSYNAKLKKLAVSAQDTNTDAITLTFDNTGGGITFDRFIFNTGTPTVTSQSIYDIQWDANGQYLYIARVGESGISADVIQYDYVNSDPNIPTTVLTSVMKVTEANSWGLQLAPDSAIYHIYQKITGGPFLLKKFTNTDTVASSVIETDQPLGPVDFMGRQFPSFSPRARNILQLSFTPPKACQNTNTIFTPTVLPGADSLRWTFGDTVSTVTFNEWSPVHYYKKSGTFKVKLLAYYQGDTTSVTQSLIVNPFDLKLTLPSDTTACHDEFPTPYGTKTRFTDSFKVTVKASGTGASGATYTWSDGETNKVLWPLKPGYYYVATSPDANGCVAYAGVNVKEYKLQDQHANIWYFGNKAGIDFNPLFAIPPAALPLALDDSNMDAPAGCAIVCDKNGQVLFYTDGDQVYDKTKTSIATGIGGDPSSSQSSLIIPVPGDETLYYIFTTQAVRFGSNNELRYTLFDLKMNNGNGGIVPGQQGVLLFSKSTERITGNKDWLIAHEWGNNTFRAYRITANGLGDPVYSGIGSDHSYEIQQNAQGYMKLGQNGNLAMALSSPGSNVVELFHLNDSTGVLSNYRKLVLSNTTGQVYGVEFSAGGNKVFASVTDAASSDIYEYSIDSVSHAHLKKRNTYAVKIGALQIAPDNNIYVAIDLDPMGNDKVGKITPSEDTTAVSTIDMSPGFGLLPGTGSHMGLPNFMQIVNNGITSPGFGFAGTCLGSPTFFAGTATDPIDKFLWSFDDGGGSTSSNPIHTFAIAKTYSVKMQLTNRCGLDTTIIQPVKINPPPASPTLSPVTNLCTSSVIRLHANSPPNIGKFFYAWSTGDTTEYYDASQAMFLSVKNTDKATGCSSTALGVVIDNRPQVNLLPDEKVCQNSAVAALDATPNITNPLYIYQWGGAGSSITQFQGVDTTIPGVFTYTVTVTDTSTPLNCFATSQKIITVNQSPVFTLTPSNLTNCASNDGILTLNGITSANWYSYFITGPTSINPGFKQNTATQPPFTNLAAGTYSVIIRDDVSGCYAYKTAALNSGTFTVTPSPTNQCDPPLITITTNATSWIYAVTNSSNGVTTPTTPPSPSAVASQPVQLPSQGQGTSITYVVQVTDNLGCVVSSNLPVTTTTTTPLFFTFDPCAGELTETTNATNRVWSGTGIVSPPPPPGNLVPLKLGTNNYHVDALSNLCPVTLDSTYTFNGVIKANFTYDSCSNSLTLLATPTSVGSYTYNWYDGAAYIGSGGPPFYYISATVPYTSNISLKIVDQSSGCTTLPKTKQVKLLGKPDILGVSSNALCKDGTTFTVTAITVNASTYQWYLNGAPISGGSAATLPLQTSDGYYRVKIAQNGCFDKDSTEVRRKRLPVGSLKPQYQICTDPENQDPATKTVDLNPGSWSAYNWFRNDTPLSVTSQVYNAGVAGKYKVIITDDFGCFGPDLTEVIISCEPIIAGPNAFRPASTHIDNTYFQLFTFYIDSFEVIVFNRWGEPVYESKDRKFNWNGGYNNDPGQPLPGGTYTYVVRYTSHYLPQDGIKELRAGVVLLR